MTNPIDAATFQRRLYIVTAVRVTHANLSTVAVWCGGTAGAASVVMPHRIVGNPWPPFAASVGDWVVQVGNRFEVRSDEAFRSEFEPLPRPKVVYQPIEGDDRG